MLDNGRGHGLRLGNVEPGSDGLRSRCFRMKNSTIAQARLQRKSGLEDQDPVFDSVRAENRGKSLAKGAGIDVNGKERLPLIRSKASSLLSADLPDLIPPHDLKDWMGARVLQLDVDGEPGGGEDGEGEDPRPHKKSSDGSHLLLLSLKEGQSS